jgi:hypothetical protein
MLRINKDIPTMNIESSMKVKVTDIVYDTESDGVIYDATELKLPTELEIELVGDNDIESEIADVISDLTGWCVEGFNYEIL